MNTSIKKAKQKTHTKENHSAQDMVGVQVLSSECYDFLASKSKQNPKPSLNPYCPISDNTHFPFIHLFQKYLLLPF